MLTLILQSRLHFYPQTDMPSKLEWFALPLTIWLIYPKLNGKPGAIGHMQIIQQIDEKFVAGSVAC